MDSKSLSRRGFVVAAAGIPGAVTAVAATSKHPVVHFEIGCRDIAATKQFYQQMFDWPIDAQNQIADAGIPGHLVSLGHEPQHYTLFYVQVDDVAAAVAKAESLGGKKLVGPITIPTGTFAWIEDNQQTTIGLWKPK